MTRDTVTRSFRKIPWLISSTAQPIQGLPSSSAKPSSCARRYTNAAPESAIPAPGWAGPPQPDRQFADPVFLLGRLGPIDDGVLFFAMLVVVIVTVIIIVVVILLTVEVEMRFKLIAHKADPDISMAGGPNGSE